MVARQLGSSSSAELQILKRVSSTFVVRLLASLPEVGSVDQDLGWLVRRLTMVVGVEVVQAVVGLLWVVLMGGEVGNLAWKVAMVAHWEIFPFLVGAL